MKPILMYRLGIFLLDWLSRIVAKHGSEEEREEYIAERNAFRRKLVDEAVKLTGTDDDLSDIPATESTESNKPAEPAGDDVDHGFVAGDKPESEYDPDGDVKEFLTHDRSTDPNDE